MSAPRSFLAVGVDGSPRDRTAVTWAAVAAGSRHLPLRLLHAQGRRFDRAGADAVSAAAEHARIVAPAVEVQSRALTGDPVAVLRDQSRDAVMLVLAPHTGEPLEAFGWSTAAALTASAPCPVVAVPPRRGPTRTAGAVVVGVDGSELSEAALAFAFDHAAAAGAALVAVHAWQDAGGDRVDDRAGGFGRVEAEQAQERVLAEALAGWTEKYPDVPVRRIVVHGPARAALLARAGTAQLLVVGSAGRAGLTGLLHGSTSQALLYELPCPLAVVRADGAR
ncbi:universal stress protein [Pseudonocardia alni]|jgi:nucleotide-binding universal stress UspA family protein|uniref:universal stress protein n=1 Tax=Pseudonocardia alni TaxID=33907 RepID=UPI0033CFE286